MRGEERDEPHAWERVRDVERREGGIYGHRRRLRAALQRQKRVGERSTSAEQSRGRRIGEVLALPRDGELKQHRRDRGEDERRQHDEPAERTVILVVAAEQEGELEHVRDRGDRARDHRRDRRDQHVTVADVGELVRDHRLCLRRRHVPEEPLRNGHGRAGWAAAGRERVRLLGRDEVQPRLRDPGTLREGGDRGVEPGRLRFT